MGEKLLKINNLKKYFPIYTRLLGIKKGDIKAVDNISFDVYSGETLGIVGESGCGKSTTGRSILRLIEPTDGEIFFKGQDITKLNNKSLRELKRDIQLIFQDPYASLDPRQSVGDILEEPLIVHNIGTAKERKEMIINMLEVVGLSSYHIKHYPHQFSGGQRQRISIARSLITRPKLIIADEPVSALDVSVQSKILNLMKDLQHDFNLTYIFIAHDLSVVRYISDRIGVMYLGKIVELGPAEELYNNPLHPYTQALISAVPDLERKKERILLKGSLPSPASPPKGCVFNTRCKFAMNICYEVEPELQNTTNNNYVACHLY